MQAIPRTVPAGGSATLTALGTDQYGNAFPVPASWAANPPGLGRFQPQTGSSVQFTAGPKGGQGTVAATAVGLTASTTLTVRPGPLHVALDPLRDRRGEDASRHRLARRPTRASRP